MLKKIKITHVIYQASDIFTYSPHGSIRVLILIFLNPLGYVKSLCFQEFQSSLSLVQSGYGSRLLFYPSSPLSTWKIVSN